MKSERWERMWKEERRRRREIRIEKAVSLGDCKVKTMSRAMGVARCNDWKTAAEALAEG